MSGRKDLLTIFIPSYNRPTQLDRALTSIFAAIKASRFANQIKVMVIDDHSTEPISPVIERHRELSHDIEFHMHREKCGIAEIAMLRSLDFIGTKYAWCLGNDDTVLPLAVDHIVEILMTSDSAFFLLNFLGREADETTYEYFSSAEKELVFKTGRDFFHQFGFVTAVTTFPCLCFEVDPVKNVDRESIFGTSPIYSHTMSFYRAFVNMPCSFVPRPVVKFNHNEVDVEQEKLTGRNLAFAHPAYFHASVGLARNLIELARSTSVPLKEIAMSSEDEVHKSSKKIKRSVTGFFIFHFSVLQMMAEIENTSRSDRDFLYLSLEEVDDLQLFFDESALANLSRLFLEARGIYCSQAPRFEKIGVLNALIVKALEFERACTEAKSADPEGYLVYGQQSGIKPLHGLRSASIQVQFLVESGFESPELRAVEKASQADLVVFNHFMTSEKFIELFSGVNSETAVWEKTMNVAELVALEEQSLNGIYTKSLLNLRWLEQVRLQSDRQNFPVRVEFINWTFFPRDKIPHRGSGLLQMLERAR